ncbi:alpha/beta hydrolase [Nocardia sp. 2]|uniref:Alpha/beta hydrolase n=1 Tax=Nocardia acididurans TaxID=2802282 RepID=A0ABS1LXE1_9NOCA|nr:alpha/beta hydrolase [Nocardia acididurans]MBL1073008.1 alpha/beta hydrolase [Nocardia acididurans]
MKKTVLALLTVLTAATLAACGDSSPADTAENATAAQQTGRYADVNGVHMYYEVHGDAKGQPPLVLLHGALSGIDTDFGELIPVLSKDRQIIAVEQQAHGHTADVAGRKLRTDTMTDDTVALLGQLGVTQADVFGYSMGAGVALDIGLRHPNLVRKLVLLSGGLGPHAMHPGLVEDLGELQPEMLYGSPFHESYLKNAPRPEDFATLVSKIKDMDQNLPTVPNAAVAAMTIPALTIIGDSDIVTPEHAVEVFRLLGGGIMGDTPAGLPNSELAIVPGASHVTVMHRPELLAPMVTAFLTREIKSQM